MGQWNAMRTEMILKAFLQRLKVDRESIEISRDNGDIYHINNRSFHNSNQLCVITLSLRYNHISLACGGFNGIYAPHLLTPLIAPRQYKRIQKLKQQIIGYYDKHMATIDETILQIFPEVQDELFEKEVLY